VAEKSGEFEVVHGWRLLGGLGVRSTGKLCAGFGTGGGEMDVKAEYLRLAKAVSDSLPEGQSMEFYRGFDHAASALGDAIGPCGCEPESGGMPDPGARVMDPVSGLFPRKLKLREALHLAFGGVEYGATWGEFRVRVVVGCDTFDLLYHEIDSCEIEDLVLFVRFCRQSGREYVGPERPEVAEAGPRVPLTMRDRHRLRQAAWNAFLPDSRQDLHLHWDDEKQIVRISGRGLTFQVEYQEIRINSTLESLQTLCAARALEAAKLRQERRKPHTQPYPEGSERPLAADVQVPYKPEGEEWKDTAMKQLAVMDRQLLEIKRLKEEVEKSRKLLGETQVRLEHRIESQKSTIDILREGMREVQVYDLRSLVDRVRKLKSEAQTEAEVGAVREIGEMFAVRSMTPEVFERLRGARCATGGEER
jgi:hypothetical protein